MSEPRIFVSHSSHDAAVAGAIVGLIRLALELPPSAIRCTSVEGHRLAGGAHTDEQLRRELFGSEVVIGIISPASIASAYVLFELGAGWGLEKMLIPILAPGVGAELLRGPLSAINALSCESQDQLHQLVSQLAATLGISKNPPETYVSAIRGVQGARGSEIPNPLAARVDFSSEWKYTISFPRPDVSSYKDEICHEIFRLADDLHLLVGYARITQNGTSLVLQEGCDNYEQPDKSWDATWNSVACQIMSEGRLQVFWELRKSGQLYRGMDDLTVTARDKLERPARLKGPFTIAPFPPKFITTGSIVYDRVTKRSAPEWE
jgi:hypothetical protein